MKQFLLWSLYLGGWFQVLSFDLSSPQGDDNLRGQVGAQRGHGCAKQRRQQRWKEAFDLATPQGDENLRGQVRAQRSHSCAKQRRQQRWQEAFDLATPRGDDIIRGQVGAQRAHGRAKQRRLQRWQEVFFSSWATATTLESMRQKFQSKKTVLKI